MNWGIAGCIFIFTGCLCLPARAAAFEENFENGLRPIWQKVEFEGETKHTIEKSGTNSVLKASAVNSATGLAVKLEPIAPAGATVSWRWKIDRIPPGGSDDVKKTFDHTGRLFVAFKTRLGPPRTINYVWSNQVPVGKTFEHPSSGRSRFIVLQHGNDKAGQWFSERRNLAQDWKQLFGNDDVPDIVGLGFMTDSDGTQTTVTGWYDDIRLASH